MMRSTVFCLALSACVPESMTPEPTTAVEGTPEELDAPGVAPAEEAPLPATGATRSGVMVPATHIDVQYVADPDNGDLLMLGDGRRDSVDLGGEPTRLVRHDDRVWVTLREAGQLAELRETHGLPELVRVAEVGAEPFDVVVSDDGERLYVSISQEDVVLQLDARTLEVTARVPVAGEPRWMALGHDPRTGGEQLAVVPYRGARVVILDLETGRQRSMAFPDLRASDVAGCSEALLTPRATGEVLWDEVEDALWFLGSYAYTRMPASPQGVLDRPDVCAPPGSGPQMYYAPAPGPDGSRFNATLLRADLLSGEPPETWLLVAENPTVPPPRTGLPLVLHGHPVTLELLRPRGPESLQIVVGLESEQAMVWAKPYEASNFRTIDFLVPPMLVAEVPGGPTSVRWAGEGDDLFVWSRLQRVRTGPTDQSEPLRAPPSELPDDVLAGRRLFNLAEGPLVTSMGGGVACASCHTDGRDDGLTWRFPDLHRQTPSLVGGISETAPYTWLANVPTVEEEARLTSQLRMGGRGLTGEAAEQVAAYLESLRPVRTPAVNDAAVDLGREVFHRPQVGCATCHSGPQGAGPAATPLRGMAAISVPALRGIAATAPYFHDGSALTLRDVLERSRDGSMGDTSLLTDEEMSALEAYLRAFDR